MFPNDKRIHLLRSLSAAGALAGGVIGAIAMLGWLLGIDQLKSVAPGVVTMKANTALAFMLSGVALWLLRRTDRRPAFERVGLASAAFVFLLSAAVFSQYVHGHGLGIDELLFEETEQAVGTVHPGRMAINTSLCFMALAAGLMTLGARRWEWISLLTGLLVFSAALVALVGYFSGVTSLYGVKGATQMALPTATAFVLLALALIGARPDRGPMRLFVSDGVGGALVRHVVPVAFGGILVLVTLRLVGQEAGLYGTKVGAWLFATAIMAFLIPLVWRVASSLERSDAERRRAEAALATSERQTRRILESAHDAFVSMDEGGRVTDLNPRAEATFGWSRDEALGHELAEMIIPEEHRAAHRRRIEDFLATGKGPVLDKPLELLTLHRDGHKFPVELTISAVETEGGYSFHAFLREITERKRAQEELAAARDEALEASRAKSMFVANVSHEIRTPMNGVIGMTELLLDTELNDEQREYAQTAASSGEALLEIIDDILDFSKIEAGKLTLNPTDFDARETIERACAMVAPRAHEKNLELAVAIDPETPSMLHGDVARLRQVIANFLSNAVKFTAAGEVVVRARVCERSEAAARLKVEVSDTGIGIERSALEQLFRPFSQADGSTTRRYGGTGLGLAISKQLIELMGGEVGADSEPGRGSRFWFEVELPVPEEGRDHPDEERDLAGLRALVVDNNATNREILERQLSSWGMSCRATQDSARALEVLGDAAAAGRPYALALLDANMPMFGGHDLARAIRLRPALRDMRLLLLTSSEVRPAGGDTAVVDSFLTKPVRQSQLYEQIQAAMRRGHTVGAPAEALDAPPESIEPRRGSTPLVLVAEDTPVNRTVATRMLDRCGYRADVVVNGREAVAALSKRPYDAVLMDCQMPALDGYEATREIRRREQHGRRTPIIAMTANSMQGDRERCLAAGMDDYLSKPLRTGALEEVLRRWMPSDLERRGALTERVDENGGGVFDEAVVTELEQLGSDVFRSLTAQYLNEAFKQLEELRRALEDGEAPSVRELAHKLKGSSGAVGAAHVANVCQGLELQATSGDLRDAPTRFSALEHALDETAGAIRRRFRTE